MPGQGRTLAVLFVMSGVVLSACTDPVVICRRAVRAGSSQWTLSDPAGSQRLDRESAEAGPLDPLVIDLAVEGGTQARVNLESVLVHDVEGASFRYRLLEELPGWVSIVPEPDCPARPWREWTGPGRTLACGFDLVLAPSSESAGSVLELRLAVALDFFCDAPFSNETTRLGEHVVQLRIEVLVGCANISCYANSECNPFTGMCLCDSGYSLAGDSCQDVDECLVEGACDGEHTLCDNTDGSYACRCEEGYALAEGGCQDVDECAQDPCEDMGRECVNEDGSYRCVCTEGYTEGGDGGCADLDECAAGACGGTFEACENLIGSYLCGCVDGYQRVSDECVPEPCVGTACTGGSLPDAGSVTLPGDGGAAVGPSDGGASG